MDAERDENLMPRIAAGNEAAFRTLSRRHVPRALAFARRIIGNEADAEEVVHEAMLRVWINAPRWRPVAQFRTWLYRIIVNLCRNRQRRAPFAPLDVAGDPADPAAGALERMERAESDQKLAAAIAGLPDRQRDAIVLTYQEGLSNAETAAMLDTSVSSVETLLVRAKRTLRKSVAENG